LDSRLVTWSHKKKKEKIKHLKLQKPPSQKKFKKIMARAVEPDVF